MKLADAILLLIFSNTYIKCFAHKNDKRVSKLSYDYPFQDPTLPVDVRLANLMSLLTPEEKVSLSTS